MKISSICFLVGLATVGVLVGCSSAGGGGSALGPAGGSANAGGKAGAGAGGAGGAQGGAGGLGAFGGQGGSSGSGNPTTCEDAAAAKSYVGCDFWPTVVPNNVWSIFDFAVVVANAGGEDAEVQVMQGNSQVATDTVPANGLKKIFLDWIPALKGPDTDSCGTATPVQNSLHVPASAYHLITTKPVSVYQFNALEYKGAGGKPGKNWGACPGNQICNNPASQNFGAPVGCFSFSNDASLLLPSTAMTGNYRISGSPGWAQANMSSYFAITGTQSGTVVKVKVSSTGQVAQGGSVIPATPAGGTLSLQLNAGDVAVLVAPPASDASGSLVQADKPVQVVHGVPCIKLPVADATGCCCDHIEESVFPAETLGKHYFVTVPTSPGGTAVGHIVRIYGNVDGTALSYPAGVQPPNAPTTINAGQVVDLGVVNQNFEIVGDKEFAVSMFQLSASRLGAGGLQGDPAASGTTAVEQYRTKYVFLAPDDYDESYVDVIMPMGTAVTIDGSAVAAAPTAIGSTGFGVARVPLGPGAGGAHVLTSDKPVGIQVVGYGSFTSYQYPGGSDLNLIAPPPLF